MSENDNSHCAGRAPTTKVAVKSWVGTPEEQSLEQPNGQNKPRCAASVLQFPVQCVNRLIVFVDI